MESGSSFNNYTEGGQLLGPIRPIGDPELMRGLEELVIPASILKDFEDASRCADYGIPRAAAVLCRSAVQGALLHKGIPDAPPQTMVNNARRTCVLSEMIHRLCLAAVFLGGKGGHPQTHWTDDIGGHEAQEALIVTRRILLELFPRPVDEPVDETDDLPF